MSFVELQSCKTKQVLQTLSLLKALEIHLFREKNTFRITVPETAAQPTTSNQPKQKKKIKISLPARK